MMVRDGLRKIFSSRVFYIIFSIVVSIALWMYVEINENQLQQITVSNVQVVRQNVDLLSDRGFLIASMTPETVELKFECSRSVASKLNNTTLSVNIDLAGITSRGNATLGYEIIYPNGITADMAGLISSSVGRISLYVDRMETRHISVDVPYKGGAAEDYIQDPPEFSPQTITVSGPTDVVARVSVARVNIARENLSSTYTDDLPFVLLDENGLEFEEALRGQLTSSDETIHVSVPIRMLKEVVLTAEFNYGAGATSQNTRYTVDPPTVTIAGNVEDIRDFNNINLGTIDLNSFDYARTFPAFSIVIPNYFTRISGETEAVVVVEILGLDMKHLSVSNIQTLNEPDGYVTEIRTQSLDVRIRGRTEDLEALSEANIRVVATLPDDINPGTQRVSARVYVDGINGDVGAVGTYNITVSITEERDIDIAPPSDSQYP
ncbi:MAG: CdaR family protein [Oscillospiraceae bacterium]|nr:CdaR family protein [Oscillospiraceae bacterium]